MKSDKEPIRIVRAYLEEHGVEEDPLYRIQRPKPVLSPAPIPRMPPSTARPTTLRPQPGDIPKPATNPMESLKTAVSTCQACGLAQRRKKSVPFGGPIPPALMLLTDLPEFYDEQLGRYFTDAPGDLVRKMITVGLEIPWPRVWVSGALKCHSPTSLGPRLEPYRACLHHLEREVDLVNPPFILGYGETTYRLLFNPAEPFDFAAVRGRTLEWHGIPIRVTHHPRELLLDPTLKKQSWEDIRDLKGRIS